MDDIVLRAGASVSRKRRLIWPAGMHGTLVEFAFATGHVVFTTVCAFGPDHDGHYSRVTLADRTTLNWDADQQALVG